MMKTGRDKKVAEEIRREVSQILYFELSDPRLAGVTITGVKMTADLRMARVFFALPDMETRREEAQKALDHSCNYVRRLLADRILIKFLPQIQFIYDESFEIEKKLKELFPETHASEGE